MQLSVWHVEGVSLSCSECTIDGLALKRLLNYKKIQKNKNYWGGKTVQWKNYKNKYMQKKKKKIKNQLALFKKIKKKMMLCQTLHSCWIY